MIFEQLTTTLISYQCKIIMYKCQPLNPGSYLIAKESKQGVKILLCFNAKKFILTSKLCAEHLLAGRNTQQVCFTLCANSKRAQRIWLTLKDPSLTSLK